MRILLIHQNFPAQFRQLAPYLRNRGHELIAICSHKRPVGHVHHVFRYEEPVAPTVAMSHGQELWHNALIRSESVAKICEHLEHINLRPDRILAHSGWGETLAIKEVWPFVPQIIWPELWLLPQHGGFGSDPLLPQPNLSHKLNQLGRNCLTRVALDHASAYVLPTNHQANSLPAEFINQKLFVIHEGIDTNIAKPNSLANFTVNGIPIDKSVPSITFVNRNLERLRGFDQFMRSLPSIQKCFPDLRIFIVGDSEKGYGELHPSGRPLRDVMLEELGTSIDQDKIHFFGRIPYDQLIALFQVSWVHVYLSYPFILGWSLLEAMACGCSIVGSIGNPVQEVLTDGVDSLLVPMDDHLSLADKIISLLSNPELRQKLSTNARSKSLSYDQALTLPLLTRLIENSNLK